MLMLDAHVGDGKYATLFTTVLVGNTVAILGLAIKIFRSFSKAKILVHRQNWRINKLWQERLDEMGIKEDTTEKELFPMD